MLTAGVVREGRSVAAAVADEDVTLPRIAAGDRDRVR
jgi:hypothetical protein